MEFKKADMKKLGMWSMAGHKLCLGCGTTERPHNGKGLCKRCYYRTLDQHSSQKQYREKKRLKVLQAYSGKYPFCACCGENEIKFLVIDHINGCGDMRRLEEGSGSALYIYLSARNYPEGYQVLCHNCNAAKEAYKICPHKQ